MSNEMMMMILTAGGLPALPPALPQLQICSQFNLKTIPYSVNSSSIFALMVVQVNTEAFLCFKKGFMSLHGLLISFLNSNQIASVLDIKTVMKESIAAP